MKKALMRKVSVLKMGASESSKKKKIKKIIKKKEKRRAQKQCSREL